MSKGLDATSDGRQEALSNAMVYRDDAVDLGRMADCVVFPYTHVDRR